LKEGGKKKRSGGGGDEIVSVMFCVGTPKQIWLVYSDVENGYLRAFNFVCYSAHQNCTFLGIRQSTVFSLNVSLRNRRPVGIYYLPLISPLRLKKN